jgi:hypothetical protein
MGSNAFMTAFTPWYQDDLPNILGINPLEATVIFGALYYFYGPTTLYKYTREAGVLFSTYAPVVKEVATDIFSEFREYLDEDREREDLKNAGVDIENIPRRTTNIIERFQESLDTFSEMTSSLDAAGVAQVVVDQEDEEGLSISSSEEEELKKKEAAVDANGNINTSTKNALVRDKEEYIIMEEDGKQIKRRRRKSKKDILAEQGLSPQGSSIAGEAEVKSKVDDSLVQSVNTIKDRFDSMQQRQQPSAAAGDPSSMMSPQMQAAITAEMEKEREEAQRKFAKQLSGDWNENVMGGDTSSSIGQGGIKSAEVDNFGWPITPDYPELDGEFGPLMQQADDPQFTVDIPESLSNSKPSPVATSSNIMIPGAVELEAPAASTDSDPAALALLKEIDDDYLRLRSKMISYIESKQAASDVVLCDESTRSGSVDESHCKEGQFDGYRAVDEEQQPPEERRGGGYWPPKAVFRYLENSS